MKKNKHDISIDIREDLESILLRFEHGEITLNEALELLIGDISDQFEMLIEVVNTLIREVGNVD